MNRINFNQTGGFPLDTDILDAVQEAYSVFNSLGSLAGDKAIISGCEKIGNNTISDGVIYLNGEILAFKGGTLGASIIIKEDTESRVFEDGATKQVIYKRYATFGSSTPEKTYQWADFKRFDNLIENAEKNLDFERRLKALETKKSPIPIGLIAIWGKPATEPIPEGWQECTDLRGRFPLGWNPDYDYQTYFMNTDAEDYCLNQIGYEGGERSHKLSIEEMPRHKHSATPYNKFSGDSREVGGNVSNSVGFDHAGPSDKELAIGNVDMVKATEQSMGGNQSHNNMPPYRIIRFIEFVGF